MCNLFKSKLTNQNGVYMHLMMEVPKKTFIIADVGVERTKSQNIVKREISRRQPQICCRHNYKIKRRLQT